MSMEKVLNLLLCLAGLCIPASATVAIVSLTTSLQSPQLLGTPLTWTAIATDSDAGPLTFQFNVAPPGGTFTNGLAKDFNVGTQSGDTYTSQPFVWGPTKVEGAYQIQVVVKDFASGQSASQTVPFHVTPLVTGKTPVAVKTANPLVALFSAPACAVGSTMRVSFQQTSQKTPATTTNWANCRANATMTFEIAGMYPSTPYEMFAQTDTGGKGTEGPTVSFASGPRPRTLVFCDFI